MKFRVSKASGGDSWYEEIKSLSGLKKLQNKYKYRLIVDFDRMTIIIYDDCME
jgi:hypothetical protein